MEEVGTSVENLRVGDRVMVPFNIYCGSCFFCARGLFANCHNVNPNATAVTGPRVRRVRKAMPDSVRTVATPAASPAITRAPSGLTASVVKRTR